MSRVTLATGAKSRTTTITTIKPVSVENVEMNPRTLSCSLYHHFTTHRDRESSTLFCRQNLHCARWLFHIDRYLTSLLEGCAFIPNTYRIQWASRATLPQGSTSTVDMPYNITDFPKEILDMIFKELVPTVDGWRWIVCPMDPFKTLDIPDDLISSMAVCRLFYDLALPWMWRVALISIKGNSRSLADDRIGGSLMDRRQWNYLRENPHLAVHIRILALEITGDDHDTSSPDLRALWSVVDLLSSVRVLRIVSDSKKDAVTSIFTSLIEKPTLHTIISSNMFLAEPPSHPRNNLTHLNIKTWLPIYENFIRMSPCLQSLAFATPYEESEHCAGFKSDLENLRIPWGTLRILTLKWVDDWRIVLNHLSSWKISHPDSSAPLSEITIELMRYNTSEEDIQYITSCGQDLRALWIGMPEVVEESTLNRIVDAFPRLQDLGLLTDGRSKSWGVNLPTVVRCLAKLPDLKRLHWNYVDEELDDDIDGEDKDELMYYENAMLASFKRIVCTVAPQCQALEKITFNDEGVDDPRQDRFFFHQYSIWRDDDGRYSDYSERSFVLDENYLNKTDWDFCSFDHVF